MRILVINHRDIKNPRAGGLEELVHQTAKYWVAWGHTVDMLCAGFDESPLEQTIDGIRVIRGPNEYVFNWWVPVQDPRDEPAPLRRDPGVYQ